MALLPRYIKKPKNDSRMSLWPPNVTDGHYMRFGTLDFRDRKIIGFNASAVRDEYQRGDISIDTLNVIYLYMPHQIQINYGQGWELSTNYIAGAGLQVIEGHKDAIKKDFSDGTKSATGEIITTLGSLAVRMAGQFTSDINKLTRDVVNPFKEPTYSGPVMRSFRFAWHLVPKTEADCDIITDIIKKFKSHSAPELTSKKQRFAFPGEFQISFHSANTLDNEYLPKIGVCICNSVSVNYTSAGLWSAFRNGHPVEVELTLDFQEVEVVTRDKIKEGY